MLLQVVNRYEPLLAHFSADAGQLHPETLYSRLLEMAGEIATFASRTKRATQFPPYRHDDLERSFAPVIADLRQLAERGSRTDRRAHSAAAAAIRHPRGGHSGS